MLPVAIEFKKLGHECFFYDTFEIYKQNLKLSEFDIISGSELNLYEQSFYKLNFFQRIRYLLIVGGRLKTLPLKYDLLIIGNDGAIQRLLNFEFHQRNRKTVLILDGLISDYSFSLKDILKYSRQKLSDIKQYLKNNLSKKTSVLFSNSKLSPFMPSIIGAANVNVIFTIGTHSKQVLNKYANPNTKIYAHGLPRMSIENCTPSEKSIQNSICYFTGAYKWHGLFSYDKYQHQDIQMIIKCLKEKKNDNIKLYLRIHPREDRADYKRYLEEHNVYFDTTETAEEALTTYGLLLTQISTVIVQGLSMKRAVYSMVINFPLWKVKNSFINNESVRKIRDLKSLNSIIERESPKNSGKNELNAHEFISRTTSNSTKLIANTIISLLNEI
jgi:hypothetical protein